MLQVHEHLQSGRRTNCRTLADSLEVSQRTILRDIDFMRDQLGLPIEYDHATRGFFYSREVVQFPSLKISEGELVALSVARKALAQYRGTPYEKPLRDAFDKLTAGLRDQIQFSWNGDQESSISFRAAGQSVSDLGIFETTSQAVLQSEELEFFYLKLGGEQAEKRRVQGLHLACIDNQWYLFGRDLHRAGSIRTFALTRMERVKNTGCRFEKPADFSLEAHLAGSFGVFSSQAAEPVRLRFDVFSARLIRERDWHPSQHLAANLDGSLELSMHIGVSPEVERWVLGWGEHVEVLTPLKLRASIASAATLMVSRNTVVGVQPI